MKPFLFLLLYAMPFCAIAQKDTTAAPIYPQDYFRNPLDIPIFLAGNFGECRPGHFHSGTDIKTLGKENQPVHAAADGYISRIKMEKGGFGHGLYITHPNGYTTLYAHLNDFTPAIQRYVKEQQYAQKRWDVDLQIPASMFPVKKGQQIAWSGNTGASTAPHLHFEIRDSKTEHPLNPELFGLPIIDHIAPVPTEVAIYDMSKSIYEQNPAIYAVHKQAGMYTPAKQTLSVGYNSIGIGVNVNDFMEGSDNTIAFYKMKLYMDGALQSQITLDDIGYDVTRYVNAYADYKTKQQHGQWIQCLFQLPGNLLDNIYQFPNSDKGKLMITDSNEHQIRIEIADDKNNVTKINFNIRSDGPNKGVVKASLQHKFEVNKVNEYSSSYAKFTLNGKCIYDEVQFDDIHTPIKDGFSEKVLIANSYIPVHKSFDLGLRATKPIPFLLRDKIVLMYSDGKETEGSAAESKEQGWYSASVRNFGDFWLVADTTAPIIISEQKGGDLSKARQITFDVKDNMTSVKKFSGYLDGKWICFEQHTSKFFYKFDEHCPKGKHTLVFKASDENNNERTFQLNFTR